MSVSIRQSRSTAGFTLVEVITALVIFSVGVVALVEGIGTSIRRQSDLIDRQRAAMIAENIMEEIAYTRDLETGENEGTQEGEDERFTWHTNIEKSDEAEETGLMAVSVEVTWGESGARGRYSLSTLMLEGPGEDDLAASDPSTAGTDSVSPSSGQSRQRGGTR